MTKITLNLKLLALGFLLVSTLFVTMDRINFGYSMKNIPIPKKEEIQLEHIFKRRLVAFKGGFVGPSVGRSVLKKFSKSFEKEVLSIK